MKPQLWVAGGPNGAGKSTVVEHYGDDRVIVVNPDIYARDLPEALDDTARILAAGRLAVRAREELLQPTASGSWGRRLRTDNSGS